MQVTVTSADGLKRELKVQVPAGDLQARVGAKLDELKNTIRLKGFRPGKVPVAHLRKTFGKPICEHQAIQLMLGEMGTRVEAARLLVEHASRAFDRGERCDMEAGMAKYFATEAALTNATEALRIHGGYGYLHDYGVEKLVRDLRVHQILEGTNEIMRVIIARDLIGQ